MANSNASKRASDTNAAGDQVQNQVSEAVDGVTRLGQACVASTAEVVVGSAEVFAGVITGVADLFTKTLRSAGEGDEAARPRISARPVDGLGDVTQHAARNIVDVMDRAQERFNTTYKRARSEVTPS